MAGVGQRLEIRQGQGLVMTPQLQQAIKLLQLSNVELAEYCEQELERNPLLERDDNAPPAAEERERVEAPAKSETVDAEIARDDFSKVADLDQASHENMYDGDTPQPGPDARQRLAHRLDHGQGRQRLRGRRRPSRIHARRWRHAEGSPARPGFDRGAVPGPGA